MELSSKISRTWKLCFIGSLLGCLVLVLYLNQNGKSVSFSAARNTVQQLPLYDESEAAPISSTFVQPMITETPEHGQPEALPRSSPPSNPPAQEFLLNGLSETPMSSSFSVPPSQEFRSYDQSEAPISSMMAKRPVQEFISNGQSKAPMSGMRATALVQEFFLHGQSEITMSSMTAKPSVQDIVAGDQSEAPVLRLDALLPVQNAMSHDESSASIISSTFSQPPISSMMNDTANLAFTSTAEKKELKSIQIKHVETPDIPMNESEKLTNKSTELKCNFFDGRWIYKPEDNPSYDSIKCPFVEEKISCQKNGRPDNEYEKWRWEAKDCDIPLFNGRDMLERLRNKRVIIVGDSLNRNMWESLSCLLYSSIPSSRAEVRAKKPDYKVLKAKDYNAVIEFHWSPFLVEYDTNHKSGKKVLVLDRLSPNSKLWRGADVMVFNSANWWTHSGKFKKWDLLQYKGKLLVEGTSLEHAYEIGLKTWAKWIQHNVDLKKTIVLFRSVSPSHNGNPHCYDVKKPINDDSPYKNKFPKSLINVTKSVLKGMSKPVILYLDITKLSEYRMDAHPSVFKSSQGKIYATKYKSLIPTFSDCSHWCLPGLPDTWNRLLYTMLFFNTS